MNSIPTIDISPLIHLNERGCNNTSTIEDDQLKDTINQIKHACESVGFFAIVNHGVSDDSIANAWDISTHFFDCDTSIKESVPMTATYPYGYENFESLGIERSVSSTASSDDDNLLVDSKETFSIGPSNSELSGMPPRQFPSNPTTLESALTQYFNDMEKLAQVLFRGLALALELNEDWFLQDGRFTSEGHQSALRVLNYPALEYEKDEGKKKVHIRAGAHTDYGAMTILKSGGPGLQLKLANNDETVNATTDDSCSWIDVPHLKDGLIINLGDLMQRWTNDRWKSTLHRVIAVSDDDDESSVGFHSARRQSMAFFVNMNGNAIIKPIESCIRKDHPSQYGEIKASDYLINRHRQSMSIKE